jgi:predicted DNA binding protein
MTADKQLDFLLIEDNPGDVRLIEEMLRGSETLVQRFDLGERFTGDIQIHHEETLESGLDRLSEGIIDVILLDLGLPDSTGLETLTAVSDATDFIPIVVLTGLNDQAMGIKAIQQGAQDYLVKDEVTSDLLARSVHYAIERNRQERERARRREQLEALNRLNEIGQDITHSVITLSTREELETAVCERLADSDLYLFAWIGEIDRVNDRVTPRTVAGTEDGYFEEVEISIDDGEIARGPTGKAVRTQTVQVMQNIQTNPDYEPWRDEALKRGYQSSVSVPIYYDDLVYGVLNIYAPSPNAFSDAEAEILSRLGEIIGHAITAIERKEALVSDTVLELVFQVDGFASELVNLTASGDSHIIVNNLIRTNETVLAYGHADNISQEEFSEALKQVPLFEEHRFLSSGNITQEFELVTRGINSLVDAIATHGGHISQVTATDGRLRFVVEFPPGRDKRQLIKLVLEHCPDAENRAQRLVERAADEASHVHSIFQNSLSEKQRTALRTAYFAGLFEWPRESTEQELAERLDVSPPTFNQHLRAAEQKFFEEVFTEEKDSHSYSDN